jgi:fructokinase
MKSVICFGEALVDFLNTSKQTEDLLVLNNYRQYPGGAPANAAVAVAKLGGKAYFAGQVGKDIFGDFLMTALKKYHVNTDFVAQHPNAKTPLAFVSLDDEGERSFTFHRNQTADILFNQDQISDTWFIHEPLFHFCSNTLTDDHIAQCTNFAVTKALQFNCAISFDVNLRHNLWPDNRVDIDVVNQLVFKSHIIKFAKEEFEYLAQGDFSGYINQCLKANCQLIIITNGAKDICYYTKTTKGNITPPQVNAIDTTAGGDGFIGGVLFALSQYLNLKNVNIKHIFKDTNKLNQIISFAAQCGAFAVTKPGAFPALPTKTDISKAFSDLFLEH